MATLQVSSRYIIERLLPNLLGVEIAGVRLSPLGDFIELDIYGSSVPESCDRVVGIIHTTVDDTKPAITQTAELEALS